MQVDGKVIVVTGAGSGIGRELVLGLIERGARVGAVDIDEETLRKTRELAGDLGDRVSVHVVDVSDPEAVSALPDAIVEAHGVVDGLINNAGVIQRFVRLLELEDDEIDRVMDVNLNGPIRLIRAVLPRLLERPEAHIVNVSSMGGFFPVPGQTVYGASKAGLKLLTEGLYAELLDTNVGVTAVFPGAIDTNIAENSGVDIPIQEEQASGVLSPMPADEAAEQIIDAIVDDEFQVYVGRDSKVMNVLYKLSPLRATKFMYEQMKGLLGSG